MNRGLTVFINKSESVYCAVRTVSSNKDTASSLKVNRSCINDTEELIYTKTICVNL